MVNEVIRSVISRKSEVRRGRWLFFSPPASIRTLIPVEQGHSRGRDERGPPVVVVFVLRWKRADGKGCGLISTYLQPEDTHALRAIRENTAAVTWGRDPPRAQERLS